MVALLVLWPSMPVWCNNDSNRVGVEVVKEEIEVTEVELVEQTEEELDTYIYKS